MELNRDNPTEFMQEKLLQQMDSAFDDLNRQVHAAADLRRMRQSGRSFRDFITDFEGKLLAANGFSWDDVLKKDCLTEALDSDLRIATVTLRSSLGYVAYRDAVSDAADRLERARPVRGQGKDSSQGALRASYLGALGRPPPPATSTPSHDPNTMDWEPTQASNAARAKWVTKEEQERRKRERLCIRCGGSGHFVKECPFRPAVNPAGRPPLHARAIVEPVLEDAPASTPQDAPTMSRGKE